MNTQCIAVYPGSNTPVVITILYFNWQIKQLVPINDPWITTGLHTWTQNVLQFPRIQRTSSYSHSLLRLTNRTAYIPLSRIDCTAETIVEAVFQLFSRGPSAGCQAAWWGATGRRCPCLLADKCTTVRAVPGDLCPSVGQKNSKWKANGAHDCWHELDVRHWMHIRYLRGGWVAIPSGVLEFRPEGCPSWK